MIGLSSSKKAQFGRSVITAILVIFIFAFLSIIMTVVGLAIFDRLEVMTIFADPIYQKTIAQFKSIYSIFDYVTLMLVFAFTIGMGFTSWRLRAHPAYFLVIFFWAFLYGTVSYFFNFMFAQLVNQSAVQTAITLFPITLIICTNLHWISLLLIVVGAITLYAKNPVQPGKGEPLT